MTSPHDATLRRFEDALAVPDDDFYELTLLVSGASDLSARAITNARQLCETYLAGRYHLAVVDLRDEPAAVLGSQVLAAPTLVKHRPLPVRKLVGDLSHTEKVLVALGVSTAEGASGAPTRTPHATTP